ncbi:MAG: glycosyl hydrolase 115 family protein [Eubacterium sp.]
MYQQKCMGKRGLAVVLSLILLGGSIGTAAPGVQARKTEKVTVKNPEITSLALKKGEKFRLKTKGNAIFQSTNKKVITVTKKGMIRAKKAGKASIKIRSKNAKKCNIRLQVRVYGKFTKVKKVTVKPKQISLKIGEKKKITASYTPKKATVKKVIWKSSDKKVANIDKSGKITARKAGKTKVTAYAADGRGAKAVCKVTVSEKKEVKTQTTSPSAAPETTAPQVSDQVTIADTAQCLTLYVDGKAKDSEGIQLVAKSFAEDVALVSESGQKPQICTENPKTDGVMLIAGSVGNNELIDSLAAQRKIDVSDITGKRECYRIQVVEQPTKDIKTAIVVAGSDKRGTIYGIYHISEMMGVSPWVYWGDAAPEKKSTITLSSKELNVTSKEPSVKYRGIFLNDEAPSLTGWVKEKFGNYNEDFYELVYQLILRCKGNYLWPAMWSNSFSEDGKQAPEANAELADKYGIIMGTSHHEPMCRAGVEWQRSYKKYGSSNAWDFSQNEQAITDFWKGGIERNKSYENVYTLGMRGEADSALSGSVAENIELLKKVIMTQKNILKENALSEAPQVLTVYKEVEDYWYGTDKVSGLKDWSELNNVTIMLCDDNFGNMRTLPTGNDINRPGGWGMYYHFDYHGGPTSYEWVNTVELSKVWEQMTMAYDHGIDDIWIVNVGI